MHREGIPLRELRTFVQQLKGLKKLQIVGLASHFADADNPTTLAATYEQIHKYQEAIRILHDEGIEPEWRHISASGGALQLYDDTFNLIRAGLVSYGISPLQQTDGVPTSIQVCPALSFSSTLAQVKYLKKGDAIGYNATFVAQHDMTVGLLPAGYYEGVDRRLSNCGTCTLKNITCHILGRVSMNMTTIDLTSVKNANVGDEVTIFSADLAAPNSISSVAKLTGTIPYDVLVHLAESVRRERVE
jgi:alanine racemase